jgi:hypothetical protein
MDGRQIIVKFIFNPLHTATSKTAKKTARVSVWRRFYLGFKIKLRTLILMQPHKSINFLQNLNHACLMFIVIQINQIYNFYVKRLLK